MSIYLTAYLSVFGYSVATNNWTPLLIVIGVLSVCLIGLGLWDRWTYSEFVEEK